MVIRRFLQAASLAGALLLTPASADSLPTSAATQADVIRGQFRQEKHLAGLDAPLVSTGSFVVAQAYGLLWRVEQPVNTTLVVDEQRMVQRVDGRQTLQLDRDDQPGLSVVAAVLTAVFRADLARLRDFFEVRVDERENGRWRLDLRPTAAGVEAVVQALRVTGADQVERIEIDEPGGDRSVIELHPAATPAKALTPEERGEFPRP